MRALTCIVVAVGTFLSAEASAQTYDPRYPVCIQVWDDRAATSRVDTHRWVNVLHQPQVVPRNVW